MSPSAFREQCGTFSLKTPHMHMPTDLVLLCTPCSFRPGIGLCCAHALESTSI